MLVDQGSDEVLREAEIRKAKAVADFVELIRIPAFIVLCVLAGFLPLWFWNAL